MLRLGLRVTAVVVLFGAGTPRAQESVRVAIGGGLAVTDADLEGAAEAEGDGVYGVFQVGFPSNLLFQVAISDTRDESSFLDPNSGSFLVEEDVLVRTELSLGYMFRVGSAFRPFVLGGLSLAKVRAELEGVEFIDDFSTAPMAGGGFEIGSEHHSFYLALTFDFGHEVDFQSGMGSEELDLRELHLGYLYRF